MPEPWAPTDGELVALLEEVGRSLAVPAASGLPERVRARLAPEPPLAAVGRRDRPAPRPARRRLLVAAAVVVAVLAGTLVASPATREAVAGWLGIGAVEIELSDRLPAETVARLDLGAEVTLAEASRRAGFPVRRPTVLGRPSAVYTRTVGPAREVTLVWPPGEGLPATPVTGVGLLLTELRGGVHPAIVKQVVGARTRVQPVEVDGGPGWWISGDPHAVTYVAPGGQEIRTATRLAGNVLLWEREGITYRLESALGRADALRLAASVV